MIELKAETIEVIKVTMKDATHTSIEYFKKDGKLLESEVKVNE